jgi:phosphate transport system substrate-binding protein
LPIRQGRCIDFGGCTLADKKEVFKIPDGTEFVCPECGSALQEIRPEPKGGGLGKILAGAALLLLLVGFGLYKLLSRPSKTPPHVPVAMSENHAILRLCGSNTIGSDLAPALAESFLKAQGATDTRILPGPKEDEKNVQGTLPGSGALSVIQIQAHGSDTAFAGLADESCDIGMASRRINTAEIANLARLGDMTSPSNEFVLGLEGIAVIVNRANPLDSISKDRLSRIFSGQITDWSAAGGRAGAIKLYARNDKSGVFDTFESLVLGTGSMAASAQRFEDSAKLSDAVASDVDGIGFVGLPYVRSAKALAVGEQGAAPMIPTLMTVATEDYPLSGRLYLYAPEHPKNPYTRKFIDFVISAAGQDVVGTKGFVTQNVTQQKETVVPGAPAEYKQLTAGAQRLSLDFRFRSGKAELDNKARADLDRVIRFVSDLHYSGGNVMLFGFADSVGAAAANKTLSENRAHAVGQEFKQRGLNLTTVRGFGSDLPVASNDTEAGREKNRRVEIWVKK